MARYGFTTREWESMRDELRRVLADVASTRSTITYGEISKMVSDGRISPRSAALGELLGEVCRIEDAARGVMLGSVVVRADSGVPGDGYFTHAGELGRDTAERLEFWRTEVERVWDSFAASGGSD
jgi:hypothetical protein